MKKVLFYFIAILLVACEANDESNIIPADALRLSDISNGYSKTLSEPLYGWRVIYRPSNSYGGFTILMKFNENGTVKIQSDLIGFHEDKENIYYEVGGVFTPELSFQTYCVWHRIYDIANGSFEFRINETNTGEFELKNIADVSSSNVINLKKATSDDYSQIIKSQETSSLLKTYNNNTEAFFKKLSLTGQLDVETSISFNLSNQLVSLKYIDANSEFTSKNIAFSYNGDIISFYEPLVINEKTLTGFQFNGLDNEGNLLISNAGDGISGFISETHIPAIETIGANNSFNNSTFHSLLEISDELVTDYNKIGNMDNFGAIQFYNNYNLGTAQLLNTISFLFTEESGNIWYNFYINSYEAIGEDKLVISYAGNYSSEITDDMMDNFQDFVTFLVNSDGFTVVPDGSKFILVSRKDSRKWIVLG